MSVKKQLYSVATISVVDKFIKLGFLIVLSRLLTPAELGVVAAAMLVVGFAEMFSNVGFGGCLIQHKVIDDRDIRTALTLSLLVGTSLATVLFICRSWIASIVGIPELVTAIPWLSLILVFRAVITISGAVLQRKLLIAKLMWIGVGSYVAGATLISIPMAIKGHGYMSVVLALVAENFLYMIGLYIATRHQLMPLLNRTSREFLLRKGMGFFVTRTINYFAENLDYFIVSRMLGPAALGFYSRAYKVMEYPSVIYRSAIDRVLFPLLSREQDNHIYLGKAITAGLFITTVISSVISAFVVANSHEIVLVLLGTQWAETAALLGILAIFTTFRLNYMICVTYIRSRGLLRIAALHSLFFMLLVGVFSYLGVPYGISGVGLGVGLAVLIYCLSYNVHVFRLAEIKLRYIAKIYAFGVLVFLWVLGVNMLTRYAFSHAYMVVLLLLNTIVTGIACLILLHPVFQSLWGDAGGQFRQQAIALLGRVAEQMIRPVRFLIACK